MSEQTYSILITEPLAAEGLLILNNHPSLQVDQCLNLSRSDLLEKIGDYHCLLVRSQTKVDKEVIERGKKLKLIGRAGVGLDNIDTELAAEHSISVINTPHANSISTAELSFALMLSLARKIPHAYNDLKAGKWNRSSFMGTELCQKVLGIFGFGNVGKNLASRAKGFGMRVIAFDPLIERSVFTEYGVEKLTKDEVLAQADFISLHCGLNEHTKELINAQNIAKMKKGVRIVNTARGQLINTDDLISALNSGHVSSAALDVFSEEPPPKNHPLLNHNNILLTPHLGASTTDAQTKVSTLLAEQTIGFFSA